MGERQRDTETEDAMGEREGVQVYALKLKNLVFQGWYFKL